MLIITVGLVTFPTCRVAKPTPRPSKEKTEIHQTSWVFLHLFCHTLRYRNLFPCSTALSYHREKLLSASLMPLHLKYPQVLLYTHKAVALSPPSSPSALTGNQSSGTARPSCAWERAAITSLFCFSGFRFLSIPCNDFLCGCLFPAYLQAAFALLADAVPNRGTSPAVSPEAVGLSRTHTHPGRMTRTDATPLTRTQPPIRPSPLRAPYLWQRGDFFK